MKKLMKYEHINENLSYNMKMFDDWAYSLYVYLISFYDFYLLNHELVSLSACPLKASKIIYVCILNMNSYLSISIYISSIYSPFSDGT